MMRSHPVSHRLLHVLRHLDGWLLAFMIALLLLSAATVYSASGQNLPRLTGHFINIFIALSVLVVVANVPPHILARLGPPLYAAALVLLVVVAVAGEVRNGSRRWLNVGVGAFQPSEIMKVALPLMLAWWFQRREGLLRGRDYALAALLVLLPFLLILRQPDLGTALLIGASGFYLLFFAGLSWRVIGLLLVLGAASLPMVWHFMHDYQRQRILTLLNPEADPLGAGYHIIQSTIAIGSGGVFGKGWLHGSQAHLGFIPESTTDFVFAVFGEEFGLLGAGVLLALYLAIVARGLYIAAYAPSLFSRLMAATVSLNFFTYAFVNMGMVSGILPVVGVPLPLMSYGGTAMITLMTGFGIIMSVATHKSLNKT